MFSGIVEEVGVVEDLKPTPGGARLVVRSSLGELKPGDSVAVNGVCLTLVEWKGQLLRGEWKGLSLSFDLSQETLSRSNLRFLKKGDPVNLERALRAGDRIGGHFLQGHVDFTSPIEALSQRGEHWELRVRVPKEYLPYVVEKGSIGIDGISLTINYIQGESISINIIPHTYQNTNLRSRKKGDLVNVELDILGKYVVNYLNLLQKDARIEKLWSGLWG